MTVHPWTASIGTLSVTSTPKFVFDISSFAVTESHNFQALLPVSINIYWSKIKEERTRYFLLFKHQLLKHKNIK